MTDTLREGGPAPTGGNDEPDFELMRRRMEADPTKVGSRASEVAAAADADALRQGLIDEGLGPNPNVPGAEGTPPAPHTPAGPPQ